jgi:hypothetical protein
MTSMEYLRKVLQNYELGVVTDAELPGAVFRRLAADNLQEFLDLISPDVLRMLRLAAEEAPRTDTEWSELIRIVGGTIDARDAEASRQADRDERMRFRRGVETLRQRFQST